MNIKEFYEKAVEQASHVVEAATPDDFELPTPDTEWNVRDLLTHMLTEMAWAADIMRGRTIAEVGSKYDGLTVEDDFKKRWKRAADAALNALDDTELTDTAHLSYGDVMMEEYLRQNGTDLAIHAWDLGEAIDQPVIFADDIAEEMYDYALESKEMLAASGLFGEPIDVPEAAELQVKLLGLYGRQH